MVIIRHTYFIIKLNQNYGKNKKTLNCSLTTQMNTKPKLLNLRGIGKTEEKNIN